MLVWPYPGEKDLYDESLRVAEDTEGESYRLPIHPPE